VVDDDLFADNIDPDLDNGGSDSDSDEPPPLMSRTICYSSSSSDDESTGPPMFGAVPYASSSDDDSDDSWNGDSGNGRGMLPFIDRYWEGLTASETESDDDETENDATTDEPDFRRGC